MTNNNSTNDSTMPIESDHAQQIDNKNNKGQKRATIAIILSLLLAGSVISYEAYQYQQSRQTIAQLKAQVAGLSSDLATQAKNNLERQTKSAEEFQNKMETQVEQQHKTIKSLQVAIGEMKGRSPNDWLLAEADYLVKMAGRKLFLEHDIESATQLMISADQRIAALNDPSLVNLRKSMAEDITQLKSLPNIDREGLVLQLISLQKEVDQLPLANALLPKEEKQEEIEVSQDINDWQTNLTTSLKDFAGHFITFRTREGSTTPLLSPTQHFYLRENIKAKFETAIKGVYSENNDIYQTALSVADKWSTSFFNQNSIKVKKFEEQLDELQKQNITVSYPKQLKTQKPLTELINERIRRSVATTSTGDK